MKMNRNEMEALYAFGCPNLKATVKRLRMVAALAPDPVAKKLFYMLSVKLSAEGVERWYCCFYCKLRVLKNHISVSRSQDIKRLKNGKRQRVYSGVVQLRMPLEKWTAKLLEYGAIRIKKDESGKERWKTMPRGKLINRTDIEILSRYNSEIRGLYNYYAIAGNVSTLNHFSSRMKYSMLKTFGSKYRCKVRKIKERYVKNGEFTVAYKTKSGMKESVYYHDGFRKKTEPALGQVDMLDIYKKYDKPNSLAIRLHTNKCELCGMDCDGLEMHQVRRLKDLNGEQEWERIMLQRRRKTLAVCPSCHIEIHNSMKS